MALSNADAVEAARAILNDQMWREQFRLRRIAVALNPRLAYSRSVGRPPVAERNDEWRAWDWDSPPAVEVPDDAPDVVKKLARKARTNYLPRILNEFTQCLIVDGYRSFGGTDNAAPWRLWQANRLDGRQGGIHRAALAYGVAYAIVLPGDPVPVIQGRSPRKLTALYADPVNDDWPVMALQHDDPLLRLYDEEQVYFLGAEKVAGGSQQFMFQTPDLKFISKEPHGSDVCPVVRYRDEMLLDEDEQTGIIEPLLALQRRLDETAFGMLVAQFYAAFRQRYVIGWVPESEEEKLAAAASNLWTFKDSKNDVAVDSLPETDLTRYIESHDSCVTDMATTSQMPHQNLGLGAIANLSAEALAAMEKGKTNRAGQFMASIGESHEQTLRLAAQLDNDEQSAADVSAQVRWKDTTARSFSQMVDGLSKLVNGLGVPSRSTWPMIPGVTDQDVAAWDKQAQQAGVVGQIEKLIADAVAAGKAPSTAEIAAVVTQQGAS